MGQRPSISPPVLIASIPEDTPGPSSAEGGQEEQEESQSEPVPDSQPGTARGRKRGSGERPRDELLELIREDMRWQREAEERRARESREGMDRLFSLLGELIKRK